MLVEHEAVAECAVVGVPDSERSQIVKTLVGPYEGGVPASDRPARGSQTLRQAVHVAALAAGLRQNLGDCLPEGRYGRPRP